MAKKVWIRSSKLRAYGSGILIFMTMLGSAGCNLCCPPYLDDYATVGGKWARANPTDGRVGSAFSDPNLNSPASDVVAYPDLGESGIPIPDDGVIIEPSGTEDAPMILGESW